MIYVKSISDTRDVPDSKVDSLVESLKTWERDSLSSALSSFETKCAEMNKNVLDSHQDGLNTKAILDQNMKDVAMASDKRK